MNPLLMVSKLQEVALKPFTHFYKEIFMVLEASGGCCESIIDGLESRGGCCEAIYALLQQVARAPRLMHKLFYDTRICSSMW